MNFKQYFIVSNLVIDFQSKANLHRDCNRIMFDLLVLFSHIVIKKVLYIMFLSNELFLVNHG